MFFEKIGCSPFWWCCALSFYAGFKLFCSAFASSSSFAISSAVGRLKSPTAAKINIYLNKAVTAGFVVVMNFNPLDQFVYERWCELFHFSKFPKSGI